MKKIFNLSLLLDTRGHKRIDLASYSNLEELDDFIMSNFTTTEDVRTKYKEVIDSLNKFLFSNKTDEPVSRKERSFEIFGREKAVDDSEVKSLLRHLEISESDLSKKDKLMLDDIWAPLDLHESVKGWRGKLALAGNTWRARWKYRHFAEMSWLRALWIQTKGVLFEKNPTI